MSKVRMTRALVNQRLAAAAEEIFGLFERTIAEYEEELCRSKEKNRRQQKLLDAVLKPEVRSHRAANILAEQEEELCCSKEKDERHQKLLDAALKPEVRSHRADFGSELRKVLVGEEGQQEWSPSLDQEDPPKPPHIEEEQEELWTSQEGEQLQGLEEADITKFLFTLVPVKSEYDEEKPQSSQLHQRQTEQMEIGADGEDCGGPEPARNSHPDTHLQSETEDSDDYSKETREPQSGLKSLKKYEISKGYMREAEPGASSSTKQMETGADGEDCGGPEPARNSHPELGPLTEDEFDNFSGAEIEVSDDDCKETSEPHPEEKPFSRTVCARRFTHQLNLSSHMHSHTIGHKEEKPFSCSFCGKRFNTKAGMIGHVALHTGEKRFSCSVCEQSFTWPSQLRKHKRVCPQSSKLHPNQPVTEDETEDSKPALETLSASNLMNEDERNTVVNMGQITNLEAHITKGGVIGHMNVHTGEKRFSCSVCEQSFYWRSQLTKHKRVCAKSSWLQQTEQNRPFTCSVCSKTFCLRIQLKSHMITHPESRPLSCSFCAKRFSNETTLKGHLRTNHTGELKYSCRVCDQKFLYYRYLTKHKCAGPKSSQLQQNQTEENSEKTFSCTVCDETFKQQGDLTEHEAIHTGDKISICGVCEKSFPSASQRSKHLCVFRRSSRLYQELGPLTEDEFDNFSGAEMEVSDDDCKETSEPHPEEKPFSCSFCGKRFNTKAGMIGHVALHTGEKRFSCSVCEQSFTWPSQLKKHKRVCPQSSKLHPNQPVTEDSKPALETLSASNLMNEDERNTVVNIGQITNLKAHMTIHKGKKRFGCSACGKKFTRKGGVRQHMVSHTGKFSCSFCGKRFNTKAGMIGHEAGHTVEKRFSCSVCEKRFAWPSQLTRHKLACPRSSQLQKTEQNRPFSCSVCRKTFCLRIQLKKHMRTHPEGKSFSCLVRAKRFSHNISLTSHMRTHHTGEKRFCCKVCDQGFLWDYQLTRHRCFGPQSSQLQQNQPEPIETGADEEDCGGPAPDRNPHPDQELGPLTEDEFDNFSGAEIEVSDDDFKETSEPHPEEKPFSCTVCAKRFTHQMNLSSHMHSHTIGHGCAGPLHKEEKPFSCSFCGKRFNTKAGMIGHVALHTGEKRFSCSVCEQSFTWPSQLRKHKRVCPQSSKLHQTEQNRPFSCSFCHKRFNTKALMIGHVALHRGEKRLSCSVCEQIFSNETTLKGHLRTNHTGELKYSCRVCDQKFLYYRYLTKHKCAGPKSSQLQQNQTEENSEKTFSCTVCDETFKQQGDLTEHEAIHTGDKISICGVCEKSFPSASQRSKHLCVFRRSSRLYQNQPEAYIEAALQEIKSEDNEDYSNESREPQSGLKFMKKYETSESGMSYGCPECGKKCRELRHLKMHVKIHGPIICPQCGQRFKRRAALKRHKVTHQGEKGYTCSICQRRFICPKWFKKHISKHITHTEENPFSCLDCGKRLSSEETLRIHRKIHMRFSCSVCGKKYEQEGKLKQHMAMHTNRFSCSVCNERFPSHYRLTKHKLVCPQSPQLSQHQIEEVESPGSSFKGEMRSNTKNKPYSCSVCGITFTQKSRLGRHMFNHVRFTCPYCGKTFAMKTTLEKHMAIHIQQNRFSCSCSVCERVFRWPYQLRRHKCNFSQLYQNQTEENRQAECQASTSTEQLHSKEEVPPEQQEWSPSLDQEDPPEPPHIKSDDDSDWEKEREPQTGLDPLEKKEVEAKGIQTDWGSSLDQEDPPEPPHIKEEQEELWTSQEGEQLQGLEEADITKFLFTPVPVKSEDDEEKPQSSQLHQRQTEQMEPGADGEDCGGPEPARNSHPDTHLQSETEDSEDDSKETREPQSGLMSLINDENSKSDMREAEPPASSSTEQMETGADGEDCGGPEPARKSHPDPHLQPETEDSEDWNDTAEHESSVNLGKKPFNGVRCNTNENPLSCSLCGKAFTQRKYLKQHMDVHTKRFSCSVCERSFTRKETLTQHMFVHSAEKTFKCSVCGIGFTQKPGLTQHMAMHTGEKPFKCSVCAKSFTRKGDLAAHMSIHTGEKIFCCNVCDQRFTWHDQLRRHTRVCPQSSQLHQTEQNREAEPGASSSTEQMETRADGEDCGGPEPARNSHPDTHLQPETEDSEDDSKETREPQSGLMSLINDENSKSDMREAEPPASSSTEQMETGADGEDCGGPEPARTSHPDF